MRKFLELSRRNPWASPSGFLEIIKLEDSVVFGLSQSYYVRSSRRFDLEMLIGEVWARPRNQPGSIRFLVLTMEDVQHALYMNAVVWATKFYVDQVQLFQLAITDSALSI
jgi:hypothetical protein